MTSSRANAFGTFLQTMNVGKTAADPATSPEFNLEESAKRALQYLSERSGRSNQKDLRDALQVNPDQIGQILGYLIKAGIIEQPREDEVVLTGFGRDALGVFSVA
ncbi:MAG: hypothetical protein WA417_17945 [Stellaceae bacterium]